MDDELFKVLLQMINIQKYPSVPYDIYRYFTLLDDLDKNRGLFFEQKGGETDFNTLSYDQISHLNFSRTVGTRISKQLKKKIRAIDTEAAEVAQYLINNTIWPHSDVEAEMRDFIANNAYSIHLYVRDIKTMVYAIFVFLSIRSLPDPAKTKVFLDLNRKIRNKIGVPDRREAEEEKKDPEEEGWVLWGKDDKKEQFLIVEKRGAKETPGIKCMNKRLADIELLLDKEQIRDEYNIVLKSKTERKRGKKKLMCDFLRNHLIKNKRYY